MTTGRPEKTWPQDFRSNLGWGRLRFKTIFIGESGSGKTQIVCRLLRLGFDASRQSTIDVDKNAIEIEVYLDDMPLRVILDVWDTAGQERFHSLAPTFYNNSFLCIMVYDITSAASFAGLSSWMECYCDPDAANRPGAGLGPECEVRNMALVGTHADLAHLREVPRERGEQLAQHYGIVFAEITSLHNQGAGELETTLAYLTEQACRAILCPPNRYVANEWLGASIPRTDPFPIYRHEQAFEINSSVSDFELDGPVHRHAHRRKQATKTIRLSTRKKKSRIRSKSLFSVPGNGDEDALGHSDSDCACA